MQRNYIAEGVASSCQATKMHHPVPKACALLTAVLRRCVEGSCDRARNATEVSMVDRTLTAAFCCGDAVSE